MSCQSGIAKAYIPTGALDKPQGLSATFKTLSFVVLAALVVSGCAGSKPHQTAPISTTPTTTSSPGPTLPPTINASVDLFSLKPELVNCQTYVMVFDASAAAVKSLLPPGYEFNAAASAVVGEVQMTVDLCESIIINNETVIPAAGLLILNARVMVNESLAKGADIQRYAFEILATNQTLVNLLRAVGLTARLAEISLQVGPPIVLQVKVENQLWYDATSVRWAPDEAPETTLALRYHHVGAPSNVRWLDYDRTYQLSSFPGDTVFRVAGGTAKTLDATNQGVIRAEAWIGISHGPISFGRL